MRELWEQGDPVNRKTLNEKGFPRGGIIMWSGSVADIPPKWALCDGENGTPDLRDRFVVGAGSAYTAGATGGEAVHKLTIAEMPSHKHGIYVYGNGPSAPMQVATSGGSSTSLDEDISIAAGGGASHNNLPPYYALCYIMRL